MIENFGVGIDLANVERFKQKSFETNKKFYQKIFTDKEIMYCLKYKNRYERFAGKFALKEALIKSINQKILFSKIETSHIKLKPVIKLLEVKEKYKFIASLSHEKNYAVAIVISKKLT
jgi:phosphopantetheine--protein transferase-like protein